MNKLFKIILLGITLTCASAQEMRVVKTQHFATDNHTRAMVQLKDFKAGNYGLYIYYSFDFEEFYIFELLEFSLDRDYCGEEMYYLDLIQYLWGERELCFWKYLIIKQPD